MHRITYLTVDLRFVSLINKNDYFILFSYLYSSLQHFFLQNHQLHDHDHFAQVCDKEYVLHLKAKTRIVAYDKLKMWVDKDTILPIRIECLTEASMLIKTIYFKENKDFGDEIARPSVIETDSPLYKGYKSVIIFAKIQKRTFKNEVFTLTFMPNLESLRQ